MNIYKSLRFIGLGVPLRFRRRVGLCVVENISNAIANLNSRRLEEVTFWCGPNRTEVGARVGRRRLKRERRWSSVS